MATATCPLLGYPHNIIMTPGGMTRRIKESSWPFCSAAPLRQASADGHGTALGMTGSIVRQGRWKSRGLCTVRKAANLAAAQHPTSSAFLIGRERQIKYH